MSLSSFNRLRRKTRDVSRTGFEAPADSIELHNKLASLKLQDNEFMFESQRLTILRRQNARINKSPPPPLPLQVDQHKLTVVLDLDETLVHSKLGSEKRAAQDLFSFAKKNTVSEELESFKISLPDGEIVTVYKRPGLDDFLKSASSKYELMTYTAGLRQYAEPLLDWLDPDATYFRHRLYRDSCLFTNGYYVKDLYKVERDLKRTVLVDNNLCCFLPQLSNGIPISSFYDDPKDDALNVLSGFLESLHNLEDVRPKLNGHFKLVETLAQTRDMLLG